MLLACHAATHIERNLSQPLSRLLYTAPALAIILINDVFRTFLTLLLSAS